MLVILLKGIVYIRQRDTCLASNAKWIHDQLTQNKPDSGFSSLLSDLYGTFDLWLLWSHVVFPTMSNRLSLDHLPSTHDESSISVLARWERTHPAGPVDQCYPHIYRKQEIKNTETRLLQIETIWLVERLMTTLMTSQEDVRSPLLILKPITTLVDVPRITTLHTQYVCIHAPDRKLTALDGRARYILKPRSSVCVDARNRWVRL